MQWHGCCRSRRGDRLLIEKQMTQIKNVLDQGRHITPLDALNEFGCFRLAARIYDLKQDGYPVSKYTEVKSNGKRVTYYYKS